LALQVPVEFIHGQRVRHRGRKARRL
jgi:hypothetical protein